MNTQILKSTGFWVTVVTTVVGLLVTQGVVLSGSSLDSVLGWVMSLAGVVGGHHIAATAQLPAAPAA